MTYLEAFLILVVILLLVFIIIDRTRSLKLAQLNFERLAKITEKQQTVNIPRSSPEVEDVQETTVRPSVTGKVGE